MPYNDHGEWYDEGGPPFVPGGGGGSYPEPPYTPILPPDGVPPDYQPALPFPNPYPPPPDRGPGASPDTPPPAQPPPSDPYNPPGGHPDIDGPVAAPPESWVTPWIAGIGGWGGSFFRGRRGPRIPSPAEQLIKAAIRGAADYFRSSSAAPKTSGWGARGNYPRPPPEWLFRIQPWLPYIGRALTGGALLGALLYEKPLGKPGQDLTPAQVAYNNLNTYPERLLPAPIGPRTKAPPENRYPGQLRTPNVLLENLPRGAAKIDYSLKGWLERGLQNAEDFGYDWLRGQIPGLPKPSPNARQQREMGPPEPKVNIGDIRTQPAAQVPAPGTVATPGVQQVNVPSTTPAKRGTFGKGTRARQRVFTFGGIGTAVLLVEAWRRGRSPSPMAGGPVSPTLTPPIVAPIVPIAPDPLTPPRESVQTYTYGGGGYATGDGYCIPRKRGPRRKCLERAPVKYSGGRRKGKPAGTKCLRWEAPKR